MKIHPLAGQVAPKSVLANIPRLVSSYYTHRPNVSEPTQQVVFGTSGHRGQNTGVHLDDRRGGSASWEKVIRGTRGL